jgi:hypothetical protein
MQSLELARSDRLFMELPEEDIQALRELVTNGRQARSIR